MFVFIARFIVAAVVTFAVIFAMSPVVYTIWYGNLRAMNSGTLQHSGDVFFANFQILAFVVPGLIIIWGFVSVLRKRVEEQVGEV